MKTKPEKKVERECYSTNQMVEMVTGVNVNDIRDLGMVKGKLSVFGIYLQRDIVGWDVIKLDEDLNKYLIKKGLAQEGEYGYAYPLDEK